MIVLTGGRTDRLRPRPGPGRSTDVRAQSRAVGLIRLSPAYPNWRFAAPARRRAPAPPRQLSRPKASAGTAIADGQSLASSVLLTRLHSTNCGSADPGRQPLARPQCSHASEEDHAVDFAGRVRPAPRATLLWND